MASPRSRRGSGPQAPLLDFKEETLASLAEGDVSSLEAGHLDGVAFQGVVREEWVVAVGDAVDRCRFDGLRAGSWTIRGARVSETVIGKADIPVVSAASSDARDLIVRDSRLGSVEAYNATWRGVRFLRCRLGFLNLRGSNLRDVAFEDCTIDEIDLLDARASRIAFPGTVLRSINVTGAALYDVDLRGADLEEVVGMAGLRGATISTDQLQQMAPALADLAGVLTQ